MLANIFETQLIERLKTNNTRRLLSVFCKDNDWRILSFLCLLNINDFEPYCVRWFEAYLTNGVYIYKWRLYIQMAFIYTNGVYIYKWRLYIQMAFIYTNGVYIYKWRLYIQMAFIYTNGVYIYKWRLYIQNFISTTIANHSQYFKKINSQLPGVFFKYFISNKILFWKRLILSIGITPHFPGDNVNNSLTTVEPR